jgi:hypothetical protein
MNSYLPQDAPDELLKAIRSSQQAFIEAIKTFADAAGSVLPKVPSVPLPFADRLPTPEDVVATTYDFAEKFLASQRQFADEMLQAAGPLLAGTSASPPATTVASA